MDLEKTLRKMKENDETFYPRVESMKRRANKGLIEGVTANDIDRVVDIIENEKEDTNITETININQEIFELNEAIMKFGGIYNTVSLEEAVTYIDNAGNLKTKSVEGYNKDMHEYHTETEIQHFKKIKKKIDYKLISENIDIDDIKKLSEMSIEEILKEEFDS